ncbi:hypothetical protein AXK11_04420 [Cephaloticoccus primus]|uniref:ABC transporter permease n=1 Tax=Cephaloticoccus primus TaxID=1548207 RepID=A0A139SPS8_9BACT|nr:ABC-2 family transporter protein [Cephaloticoccus primus]KXU36490.1 hypothetical protein AXK11_04420 [Cephaloticoccus primus]
MRQAAKYAQVFLVGLQSNLVYRWNFLLRGSFSLFHLLGVFILWGAAFQGTDSIGGFDVRQTMTYFISLIVLQFFIAASNEDHQISDEIRNGLINQFLLKPISYFLYRFTIYLSARLVSGLLILVPLALAYPLLRHYIVLPDEAWRYAAAIPALILSGLIQFSIAYCFGLLTFWFLEIQGFIMLSYAIETVLGGNLFPLDLMPGPIFKIAQWLPFYYQMYFPAAILTGRIGPELAAQGLLIQSAWVCAFFLLNHLLWKRGLRLHTAVGG